MKRGSLELDETVALIITVAAILILITWWAINQMSIMNMQEIERCRLSVLSYAKSWVDPVDIPGMADQHLFDVDCKRRVVTFNKRGIEVNGKSKKFYDPEKERYAKSYGKLTPEILNSVAASEMSICWYEFLEGKSYFTNEIDLDNDNTACYVCGELRFAPDVEYDASGQEKFFSFLASKKSVPYPQGRELTYLEYLYLGEHLCDYSGESMLPGTSDPTVVGEGLGIPGVGAGISWYKKNEPETCEEQFLNKALIGGKIERWGIGIPLGQTYKAIRFESYQPPMENLTLNASQSYYIVFYQLGEDKDKEDGKTTGTTYAPMLLPSTRFTGKTCEKFIG